MTDVFTIKSSRSSGSLVFSDRKPANGTRPVEYLRVGLKERDITASSSQVYLYEAFALSSFFAELAGEWKGWEGEKEWSSVENDFALSAISDGLGHVALHVTLKSGPYEDDWCVKGVIYIDAGQLAELAHEIKAFLYVNESANKRLKRRCR
jgi:hypothetical protein